MDGNDKTVASLQGIWNEMKTLNNRVNATNERLEAGFTRMEAGFAQIDRRFDPLLLGEHGREHREFRERLARLEQRASLPPIVTPYQPPRRRAPPDQRPRSTPA